MDVKKGKKFDDLGREATDKKWVVALEDGSILFADNPFLADFLVGDLQDSKTDFVNLISSIPKKDGEGIYINKDYIVTVIPMEIYLKQKVNDKPTLPH